MYSLYDLTGINIQPVIKYESYDPDYEPDDPGTDVNNDAESMITFGINYFFNDWTRLQLNYLYKAEETEIFNDEFLMQLQVKF